MALYRGEPNWHEEVYQVEVFDPVVGGSVSWRGNYPTSGYSNATSQQLADRTSYLKVKVDEILMDLERGVLSKVYSQDTSSIEIVGEGVEGNPLRANLKESLDTIAWVRKDNTFTRNNFFRGVTEVEDPTTARGAVNKRTLESGLTSKADETYVDEELSKKQNNLTAGDNIQLDASTSVISATDTKYSAGNGLTLSGTTFSLPVTITGTGTFVESVAQSDDGITVTLATPPSSDYSIMSLAELRAGSATAARTMSAKNIDDFTTFVTLSGTSVTPDMNSGRNFTFTPTDNSTISNPTNLRSGQTGDIVITFGSTLYTVGWESAWKFAGGTPPDGAEDSILVVSYKVVDEDTIICAWGKDIK